MWHWLLILGGGLLGTGHCLGMCGGFVTLLSVTGVTGRRFWLRQLAYHAGRVTTYALLGGLAGGVGQRLLSAWPWLTPAWWMTAGVLLIVAALLTLGWLPRVRLGSGKSAAAVCQAAELFRTCLNGVHLAPVWLAGALNGLIPCGLVMTYLVIAAGTGHPLVGAAILLVFGAGTLPGLLLAGAGVRQLSVAWRQRLQHLAAACVGLTGMLTAARGWAAWDQPPAPCPYCRLVITQPTEKTTHPVSNLPGEVRR